MSTVQKIRTTSADEIRTLLVDYFDAIKSKNVSRITAFYAPDIRAFDAILALQFRGRDAYAEHWKACMEYCAHMTEFVFEMHDAEISAGDDVAFASSINRCGGIDEKGDEQAAYMRGTIGLERRDGRWVIVHEHYSAPFDPETNKALFDLKP